MRLFAATAANAAQIASLEAMLFSDAWSEGSVAATLSSPLSAAFAVEISGKTVGYLICSLLRPEGELLRIGVHPLYRRKGLGSRLMEAFFREAMARGCTELFLEVRADNETAIALYRRFGFEENGLRRAYYKNPTADALLMRNGFVGSENN